MKTKHVLGLTNLYFFGKGMKGQAVPFLVDEDFIRQERQKARKLRQTKWWRKKCIRGICYYCGRKFKPSELTMDHLVPLSRGGQSVRENIVPACKECNSKKKYMLPWEWEEYLRKLKGETSNV